MSIETSKLPEKPSELILIALKDLKSAEESKKYEIEMGDWHNPPIPNIYGDIDKKCEVCFAGSVMAFSLEGDINRHYEPKDFPGEEGKLNALDCFRLGQIHWGLKAFFEDDHFNCTSIQFYIDIPYYHYDREGFYEAMAEMADYLKKEEY